VIELTTYLETKRHIIQIASMTNMPILGEFELTRKCNFNCQMCYLDDIDLKSELSVLEWKALFKEAVSHGLLYALLTGGEILLLPYFIELYEYLYDLGVKITVYTNASHIKPSIISSFKNRPPELVGVTIYGANNETYQKVTSVQNGFDLIDKGISLLQKNNLNVVLRTIPLQPIYDELDLIMDYALKKNLYLGYFLYVGPSRNLDYLTIQNRLTPEDLIDFEKKIKTTFQIESSKTLEKFETHSNCIALKSAYFVDSYGYMQPCSMMNLPNKKIEPYTLLDVFLELGKKWNELGECKECMDCSLKGTCIQCKARRHLEGNIKYCSPYLNEIALIRSRND